MWFTSPLLSNLAFSTCQFYWWQQEPSDVATRMSLPFRHASHLAEGDYDNIRECVSRVVFTNKFMCTFKLIFSHFNNFLHFRLSGAAYSIKISQSIENRGSQILPRNNSLYDNSIDWNAKSRRQEKMMWTGHTTWKINRSIFFSFTSPVENFINFFFPSRISR